MLLLLVVCFLQCTDWRNQKERSLQAGSPSEEKDQEEDWTPGWRHFGGSGSVLLPAGTGKGAAERQGVRDTTTSRNCCLSYLYDAGAEMEARPGYSNTTRVSPGLPGTNLLEKLILLWILNYMQKKSSVRLEHQDVLYMWHAIIFIHSLLISRTKNYLDTLT